MRKFCHFLSAVFVFLFINSIAVAQNNLAAGDIAIVSYQSDQDPAGAPLEDRFSIVILNPAGLASGTVLYFTDRGWDGPNVTWLDNATVGHEAVIKWVVPAGGIAFGTEVYFISNYNAGTNTWGAFTTQAGTIALGTVTSETDPLIDGGMGFTVSGDELLVYQTGAVGGPAGAYNATPIRFVTALLANLVANSTTAAGWDATPVSLNESSLPPGLTNAVTAFIMSPSTLPTATVDGTTEPDNGKYNCTGSLVCNIASLTSAVIYNAAKWDFSNNAFALGLSSNNCTYGTPPPITINAPAVTQPTCSVNTGTIVVNATGGTGTLQYQLNGGAFQLSNTFSLLTPGNYNISVRSQSVPDCITNYSGNPVVINGSPATFTASVVKTNITACNAGNDGTITVTPTGGTGPYTYAWSGGYPGFNPGNVSSVSNLPIGYYNVSITDAGGCGVVTLSNIHIQFAFYVYVTSSGSVSSSCSPTGSILLYGNAGVQPYTYSLDGTNYQQSNTFTGLPAGTYTGYVKDAGGCVSTKPNIIIGAAAPITVTPFARTASSCSNDGAIEIYRSGGISPYLYSLDNVTYQVSNLFSNLPAGSYTAYVKDSKGCIGQQNVIVQQGVALTVTANKFNTSTCINDGLIQVGASGGQSPYTYSINGVTFQPGFSFNGLGAGSYTVTVKDFKGCLGTLNVTIGLNEINVTAFASPAGSCQVNNGSIQLFRTGGVGPYTYSLDGNIYQSGTIFTGLAAGFYNGYVKDSKGCVGVLNGIFVGPDCPPPPVAGTNSKGGAEVADVIMNKSITLNVYPNPAISEFTLQMNGMMNNESVTVTVRDLLGRKVFQSAGIARQQYKFGKNFGTGIYFAEVTRGNERQTIKLVKE